MSRARWVLAVLWRLAVVAAVAVVVFVFAPTSQSDQQKHFRVTDANVLIQVEPNGALIVNERLRYDFSGSFSGAYRDIPLRGGAEITAVGVRERGGPPFKSGGNTALGSFDLPGKYGVESLRFGVGNERVDGARIVWHYRAKDTQRTFDIAYRVEGATVAYDDVVDVGWVVWGDQWNFWLDELRAEIVPPDGAEPVAAWARPRSLDAAVGVGEIAAMELERAPQGDEISFRALVPRAAFGDLTAARSAAGSGLRKAEREERALDDDVSTLTKVRNAIAAEADRLAIGWTILVLGLTGALVAAARERPTDAPRYLPVPPEDIPPALAYAIAMEGTYDRRLVVATLLDLADRGYYDAAPGGGTELDLELAVPDERPALDALKPYEVDAMEFFDGLLKEERVALGKLKNKVPKHSAAWRTRWEELNESLDQAEDGEIGWDRDLVRTRDWLAAVALVGYLVILGAFFSRTFQFEIPLVAAVFGMLFLFLPPGTALKRLDPEARVRHARWRAFRRWTEDFPSLDDDPPATLKLWRSILVYAVAFGTADRIARSGRIPPPVAEGADGWAYAAIHHTSISSSFDGFAPGFSGQVAAQSSSGGGGGGGGGGGFSGGGGGGAW